MWASRGLSAGNWWHRVAIVVAFLGLLGAACTENQCEVGAGECVEGNVQEITCGLNGQGTMARTYTDGDWGLWGVCEDPDQCTNGSVLNEACGANDSGSRSRTCAAGQWRPWEACQGADSCTTGTMESRACGAEGGGNQSRICVNGVWAVWGECGEPVSGCTDPEAINHDVTATVDDGSCVVCEVRSLPFMESFEGGLDQCLLTFVTGDGFVLSAGGAGGTGVAMMHSDGQGPQDDGLIFPAVDLGDALNPELRFWEMNASSQYYSYHGVLISTDDGESWSELEELDTPLNQWAERRIPLWPYAGETVRVAFSYKGNNADVWFIDEVVLLDADSCEGIVCDDPPAPYCEGDGVVSSAAQGTCESGVCVYAPSTQACGEGETCEAGTCLGSVEVKGCTDPDAENYNPTATVDDGSCGDCAAQVLPFRESFEVPLSSCFALSFDGAGFVRFFGGADGTGISMMHSWGAEPQSDLLVLPPLTLEGAVDPELRFYQKNEDNEYYYYHAVFTSVDGGATWVELVELSASVPEWELVRVSLSEYVGEEVLIGLYYEGASADVWYVDEVEVWDTQGERGAGPSTTCTDDASWVDDEGDGCDAYTESPSWCQLAPMYVNAGGKDATEACCVCGGGTGT